MIGKFCKQASSHLIDTGAGLNTLVPGKYDFEGARELGQGLKVNPYIVIPAGETAVLADIKGEGAITHCWITDTAERGRLLLLRIYFDGQKAPLLHCAGFYFTKKFPFFHRGLTSAR